MKQMVATASRRTARAFSGVVAAAMLLAGTPAVAAPEPALMPLPQKMTVGEGTLRLVGLPTYTVTGCAGPLVAGATQRFSRDFATLVGTSLTGADVPVRVRCRTADGAIIGVDTREGYRLTVAADGITIDADSDHGVLRALATLRQMIGRDAKGPILPHTQVDDAPRFAWRGLMIDTARHFMSVAAIKRQIDAMELAKLSVLHLHLSDNEAFRVQSRRYPRLTEIAAPGGFYTQADLRDIVRHAADRGVRVVPEFDMPGHNLALLTAYPELGVAPIAAKDPLAKPKGALDPSSEKTYRFLSGFLREIAPLFPDRYFHLGGDEVSDVAWQGSAAVDALKRRERLTTKGEVEAYFHKRVRAMLARHGKTAIGWDEIADCPLPRDVIVQAWRTSNPVASATAKGNRVIVSAGYYLDQLRPADALHAIDPLDPNAYATMTREDLVRVRRNPATAAQVSDGLAATPQPPLSAEQQRLVLGVEAPLWAELVTDEMLDGRLWPRGLAIGDRGWSPAGAGKIYARMLPAMNQLRALGLLDDAHRDRMIARLAPDSPEVVRTLVDLVAPVRNFARAIRVMLKVQPELIELADAASTDGSVARRFRINVDAYAAGDRTRAALLRRDLAAWRDNEAAFVAVAAGRPLLQAAVPTARDIGALGRLGLAALDAIDAGRPLSPSMLAESRELRAKLAKYEEASASLSKLSTMRQPPADLIILVTGDVQRLIDAAMDPRGQAR